MLPFCFDLNSCNLKGLLISKLNMVFEFQILLYSSFIFWRQSTISFLRNVSLACKIFQYFRLRWILSFYQIEVFIWKFEYVAIYICLVSGVVIFDESWAGKGIGSRVNNVHGPVFRDAEVNSAMNLTYSEHRLADIHCSTIGEPFECSIFCCGNWELMTDKLSEVLFLFIYK